MNATHGRIAFAALIALGIIDRLILLVLFGFHHTGTDDVIIWEMARDYSHGIHHEPYMYGQNYNPMLEALLGAPFLRPGVPPWIVLPIVTSLLALAPFWSFAIWHFRRGERAAACVFAVVPLLLPVEWGMLTTITRGFVQGIALLALLPWAMSARNERGRHVLTALVIGAGLFFNPNALIFVVPVAVVLLFRHAREPWFWLGSLLGMLPAVIAWWSARAFYLAYPYPMHHMIMGWELEFRPRLIGEGFAQLDSYFSVFVPFGAAGPLVPPVLFVLAIALWAARSRPQAAGILCGIAFMIFSLGFYKVHDGVDSIFYPRARMFLAVPLLIAWGIAELVRFRALRAWGIALTVVGAGFVVIKAATARGVIDHEMTHQQGALVREEVIGIVRARCETIKAAAWESGADAIITLRWPDLKVDPDPHFRTYFDCYGCSHLVIGLPPTYGPGYERRSWVHDQMTARIPRDPLFVGGDPAAWDRFRQADPKVIRSADAPLLHLIPNNTTPIDSIVVQWDLGQMR